MNYANHMNIDSDLSTNHMNTGPNHFLSTKTMTMQLPTLAKNKGRDRAFNSRLRLHFS